MGQQKEEWILLNQSLIHASMKGKIKINWNTVQVSTFFFIGLMISTALSIVFFLQNQTELTNAAFTLTLFFGACTVFMIGYEFI